MSVKFANNASTALDGALTNSATSFDVVDASVFPAIASPDFCFLTIVEGSNLEIIKVTDITGNTLTATRGQDGTSGVAFSSGARIDLRMTKAMLDELHGSVAVSANDTSPGRLLDKLTEGAGITLTENNDGANEDIEVGVDPDAVVTKTATTGSALVAVGTTAQRDASPTEGGIRGNSDNGVFEGYIGGGWIQFGDLGQIQAQAYTWCGVAGGSKNALTLSPSPAITAYAAGQRFVAIIGGTSSDDAVTIAVSGISGAKAVQIDGAACSASAPSR